MMLVARPGRRVPGPARRLSRALTGPNDQRRKPASNRPDLYQQKDHKLDPPFQLRVEGPDLVSGLSRLKLPLASPGNQPIPPSAGKPKADRNIRRKHGCGPVRAVSFFVHRACRRTNPCRRRRLAHPGVGRRPRAVLYVESEAPLRRPVRRAAKSAQECTKTNKNPRYRANPFLPVNI